MLPCRRDKCIGRACGNFNDPTSKLGKPNLPAGCKGGGILLIFARTDTALWQDLIFPFAERILYIRGRLTFCREDGTTETTATAPSALIAFANEDADVLDNCEIEGARQ